jgi:hypothetical protein
VRLYNAPLGEELDALCVRRCALVSLQPVAPDPLPPAPPPPRIRDANGLSAHLVISLHGGSRTNDERISFGADPGTYRLRVGWEAKPGGGSGSYRMVHFDLAEPLPFAQRFLLTVLAPGAALIVPPRFGELAPAPYTFLRVLRGPVTDEANLLVPENVDLPLSGWYFCRADALYQFGLEV